MLRNGFQHVREIAKEKLLYYTGYLLDSLTLMVNSAKDVFDKCNKTRQCIKGTKLLHTMETPGMQTFTDKVRNTLDATIITIIIIIFVVAVKHHHHHHHHL
jgi:hypothetical protein